MKTELLKQYLKNSIYIILILVLIYLFFTGHNYVPEFFNTDDEEHPKGRGFTLQRFDVINTQLDSIILEYKNGREGDKDKDLITILYLNLNDSAEVMVGMMLADKRYNVISKKQIFEDHNRIVGFIVADSDTLIVLSNISDIVDFGFNVYKFIRPTNDKRYFDFIYFPDDLYCLTDENGIPCVPSSYELFRRWYTYKGNKFVFNAELYE